MKFRIFYFNINYILFLLSLSFFLRVDSAQFFSSARWFSLHHRCLRKENKNHRKSLEKSREKNNGESFLTFNFEKVKLEIVISRIAFFLVHKCSVILLLPQNIFSCNCAINIDRNPLSQMTANC